MKQNCRIGLCLLWLIWGSISAQAGVVTYQFISAQWKSQIGASLCDNKTDGWVSIKDGYGYSAGYLDINNVPYSKGVEVKRSVSGAGAQSIQAYEGVKRLIFNFCMNQSAGKGVIYAQVGDNPYDSIVIGRPAKQQGQWLRDSIIQLDAPQDGKIKFWVSCSENGININSLTIVSEKNGSEFTTAQYQLVTSTSQLQDSDQIIIGVHPSGYNYVLGYYDERISRNNIHAIKCRYSDDRLQVDGKDEAIYTLRKGQTSKGVEAWYIQDEIRYEEAYLVASGGQTKNTLAVWTHLYDSKTYGDYGYWDIQIGQDGRAVVMNLGNSKGKYLQYNAKNSPTLFGCYESLSQTDICIYRRVEAQVEEKSIVVPMVNFGTHVFPSQAGTYTDSKSITIVGNLLEEDIQIRLKQGIHFSVSDASIDKSGEIITVSCTAQQAGHYSDTLIVSSDGITKEAVVILNLEKEMTIREATEQADYTTIYLGEVVVTKKYDKNIYIRDDTGSMLIFDGGNGEGSWYGSGLATGDVLHNVTGKFYNYYGIPEISPAKAWKTDTKKTEVNAEVVAQLDSADVCRLVRLENAIISNNRVLWNGQSIAIRNAFDINIRTGIALDLDAIVSWEYDTLTLLPCSQSMPTALEEMDEAISIKKTVLQGILIIEQDGQTYTITGQRR